jgi:hypothetical protein
MAYNHRGHSSSIHKYLMMWSLVQGAFVQNSLEAATRSFPMLFRIDARETSKKVYLAKEQA